MSEITKPITSERTTPIVSKLSRLRAELEKQCDKLGHGNLTQLHFENCVRTGFEAIAEILDEYENKLQAAIRDVRANAGRTGRHIPDEEKPPQDYSRTREQEPEHPEGESNLDKTA